ncbi:hypothetical protein [Bradyrhizobium prioriisuperbiae]|uniref:hypothetical protein n=1 Tax=Bradyrhizobium prioriisuperbiae TaxID=2854389 RepID=UPI0028E2FDAA|nr:hypothetical protein [Bradyrhizobium prioritasuperba]
MFNKPDKIENGGSARRHVLIAGTGRAGTSFLVKYLTALGLDTGFQLDQKSAPWDENANAGLEHLLLVHPDAELPYVLKSPWAGEYIEQILQSGRFVFDAIIVPMRDLVEAASSRSIIEHRAIHQGNPWMADRLDATWEVFGHTPGGVIYSLNPLDQARLLAMGFHRLVHRAAEAGTPLIFPVFPRMIEDWSYLYQTLKPILPAIVTIEQAREAHSRTASEALVRVEAEKRSHDESSDPDARKLLQHSQGAELDMIALRRELRRVREEKRADVVRLQAELSETNGKLEQVCVQERETAARLSERYEALEQVCVQERETAARLSERYEALEQVCVQEREAAARLSEQCEALERVRKVLEATETDLQQEAAKRRSLEEAVTALQAENKALRDHVQSLVNSRSWKITSPLRRLASPLRDR